MEGINGSPRVALFMDVENLVIEVQKAALTFQMEPLLDRAKEAGILSFARAYGDWTSSMLTRLVGQFQTCSVQMEQLPTAWGKNTADLLLSLDALEMCLQPNGPDTVVVVGGDRDFVPLVQKLRRYGMKVIGVGVESSSSRYLANACDEYVFYEDLLRSEEEDADLPEERKASVNKVSDTAGVKLDPHIETAFNLLVRAIGAQARAGSTPKGSTVRVVMQRLDPVFDPARLGYQGFKEFALAAAKAGFVEVIEHPGTDMELAARVGAVSSPDPGPSSASEPCSYDTDEEAYASYRRILVDVRRVPIIPWSERETLIRFLWEELEQSGPDGLTIQDMNRRLQRFAEGKGLSQPVRALQKLTHTLNIGECFSRNGKTTYEPDISWTRLCAARSLEDAFVCMHTTYLVSILGVDQAASLRPVAVARLLFDSDTEENVASAKGLIAEAKRKASEKWGRRGS